MIYNWLKNNLFGQVSKPCFLCLAKTHNKHLLCSGCENDLPRNTGHCVICAIPFPSTPFLSDQALQHALVCGNCQKNQPHFTTSLIPFIYATPVKQLIANLKFHGNLGYAPLLAHGFIGSVKRSKNKLPECIIPVPLHKKRLQERGFNQALELARIITKQLQIPLEVSLCERNKITPFQSGLSAKQRKQNMKGAFSVARQHNYKHIAIFDDVVTTGTTVNELAKELKQSGVKTIEVWAIARTQNKNN